MLRKWFSVPEEEEIAPAAPQVRNEPADPTREHPPQQEGSGARPLNAGGAPAPGAAPGRYSSFEQIYQSVTNKLPRVNYNILKVAEMMTSSHLSSMSTEAKRCSLLMALEAAGVAVEDVLQDAVLRQKALSEYEEVQKGRLKSFEQTKADENAKIQAELEKTTKAYMARIQANLDEIAREQDNFRTWQKSKNQECDRLTQAAEYCVPQSNGIGVSSLAAVLERATSQQ
jgi:hypothetical protein